MIPRAKMRQHAPKIVLFLLILSLFLVACERPLANNGAEDVEATAEATTDLEQGGGIEVAPTEVATEPAPTAEEPAATEEEESAIPSQEETAAPEETQGEEVTETVEATAVATAEATAEAAEETVEATPEATAEAESALGGAEGDSEVGGGVAEGEAESEAAAAEAEQTSTGERIHVVQPGENLYRIGLQYGISWVVLRDYNNLPNGNRIYVGQEIRIPGEPDTGGGGTPDNPNTYVVKPGDTLYSIGRAFDIDWREIATANNIVNPYRIYVGRELTIPGGTTPPTELTHTVSPGESLFSISLYYGVPWTKIATANEIEAPYIIYPGDQLTIPVGD